MKILIEMHNGKVTNILTSEGCKLFIVNHDDKTNEHLNTLDLIGKSMELDARVMDATILAAKKS